MSDGRYGAQEALLAPVRRTCEPWRLLVGLGVVALVVLGLNALLGTAMTTLAPRFWITQIVAADAQGGTPLSMLVLLGSFGFVAIGTAVAVTWLHRRPIGGVFGPLPVLIGQFRRSLVALTLLGAVLLVLPPFWQPGDVVANLPLSRWVALLPLSLAGVLIQSSAEEMLFRGYIQQQLAARFASRWVWMVLPSVLFALGHFQPGEAGDNALIIAAWSGVFGLLMADLTARAGTLGPAIAVHLVTNVASLLLVSLPDSLNGLALYTVPYDIADTGALRAWLPGDFAMLLVSWLAARLAIRR